MDLNLAFTDSAAGHALLVAITFVLLKLIATVIQVMMLRGDYRHMPKTLFYRSVYITGKVTPAFAAGFAFLAALLQHNRAYSWFFGSFAIFATFLAIYVIRLRKQGRFFGILDLFSKREF
jgi:hypothetical protein